MPLPQENRAWRITLRRGIGTCAASLACLLTILPAAQAQDDDGPPPSDRILAGLLCFVLALAWLLVVCLRAPRTARQQQNPLRRRRPRPLWLPRWLYWDFLVGRKRPPNGASRQVRRAFQRRHR
jgi:hypothetical protein